MIDKGDNTYGGKYVVNPSGGLISKGHPLGATGSVITYCNRDFLGTNSQHKEPISLGSQSTLGVMVIL